MESIKRIDLATTLGTRFLAVLVVGLSLRGVWGVLRAEQFPAWFGPLFGLGSACILPLVVHSAFANYTPRSETARVTALLTWGMLALSFICTTSLHSFYPFRVGLLDVLDKRPTLQLNLLLAACGFSMTLALAGWDALGHRRQACFALVCCAPLLLLPNDDCANPFNAWWIDQIGASPLMYVPNVMAVILAVRVLRSERAGFQLWLLAGVCLSTLLLGMSHRTGLVW